MPLINQCHKARAFLGKNRPLCVAKVWQQCEEAEGAAMLSIHFAHFLCDDGNQFRVRHWVNFAYSWEHFYAYIALNLSQLGRVVDNVWMGH